MKVTKSDTALVKSTMFADARNFKNLDHFPEKDG
jgi:hypothetical protein